MQCSATRRRVWDSRTACQLGLTLGQNCRLTPVYLPMQLVVNYADIDV